MPHQRASRRLSVRPLRTEMSHQCPSRTPIRLFSGIDPSMDRSRVPPGKPSSRRRDLSLEQNIAASPARALLLGLRLRRRQPYGSWETEAPSQPLMSDLDPKRRCTGSTNTSPPATRGGAFLVLCFLQAVLLAVGDSQQTTLLDFAAARHRMVEQLSAPGRGIKYRAVLCVLALESR